MPGRCNPGYTSIDMVHNIILEIQIKEMLKPVHDPELPADIYELGLVYDINISDNGFVNIKKPFPCLLGGIQHIHQELSIAYLHNRNNEC